MKDLFWIALISIILSINFCDSLNLSMTYLNMKAENLKCIDFDTLNQLKKLEIINFEDGNMPYFPDKDCNNSAHEEDTRALDLPNLRMLVLKRIKLLKVPNTSMMPNLENVIISQNAIAEIPGTHFRHNGKLEGLDIKYNDLTAPPNITGSCSKLSYLGLASNDITTIPDDYFKGCSVGNLQLGFNKITSFPNIAPLGNSLSYFNVYNNQIPGMILDSMMTDFGKLMELYMAGNKLQGIDVSFCKGNHPIDIHANRNFNLTFFENPYRFCPHLLDTFATKPRLILTDTQIPCDNHRCWMKKYASKLNIQINDCPDGRKWAALTEADVCGQG